MIFRSSATKSGSTGPKTNDARARGNLGGRIRLI